jgi:hypothetical protein
VVETLLFLHLALLVALFLLLQRKIGRIIALVFFVYMIAFTTLKPVMLYYFDFYLPFSTNDYSAVVAMLFGSLLFLSVQYLAVKYFSGYRPGRPLIQWFDFSRARPRGIWLTYLALMVISFIGSTIKFADAGYLLSSASAFDASMNQADGSWYINYVSESLFYGAILVMAFYCSRMAPVKSFALLVFVLALTYIWVKMAARTGVLVMLIAWLSCSLSAARQRSLSIFRVALFGYFLLILLYVGNFVRLGNTEDINIARAGFGAAIAAVSDLSPVDCSVLLYSEMHNYDSTNFSQLVGAITPIVLIPSAVLPIKIRADKDSVLTKMFFPEGIDTRFYHEGGTLTFTVPGSGYADAGFFGVLVASLVYAALFCVYIWIYRRGSASARFIAAVFMLSHIVGYRLSVESLLMTFYTTMLFIGIARWAAISLSKLGSSERGTAIGAKT